MTFGVALMTSTNHTLRSLETYAVILQAGWYLAFPMGDAELKRKSTTESMQKVKKKIKNIKKNPLPVLSFIQ